MLYEDYIRKQVDNGSCGVAIIPANIAIGIADYIEHQRKKHGNWLGSYCPYTCDQCGKHSDSMTNFCWNCGADMRERVTLNELSQKLWER